MKLLRWLCVVPAGIVAAVLVAFPTHWLVMINLGGWAMDPLIEIRDPKTLRTIELVLQSALSPLAFIYVAARTAPDHKQVTSIVLSGIIVIGLPILAWWWNAQTVSRGSGVLLEHGFAKIVANVISAAAAILLIRSHERKQLNHDS
jgi:hypothetical protein